MADNTSTEAAKGGAIGRIVRIVGAVVDVEFPADAMPAIYNALTVKAQTPTGEVSTVLEVQTHLPGDIVRTVAMTSTDGMVRGLEATDTGSPIMMPVGKATLGRIWNVLGEPVDGKPMPEDVEWRPIHHPAPPFDTLVTTTETFETGIKVVDLIEPYVKGGKTERPVALCSAAWCAGVGSHHDARPSHLHPRRREKPMPEVEGYMPIHHPAPDYDNWLHHRDLRDRHGVDLRQALYVKGGKTGGGTGVGKTVTDLINNLARSVFTVGRLRRAPTSSPK